MTNNITVKYLASLSDTLSKQSEIISELDVEGLEDGLSVAAIWTMVNPDVAMPSNTVCAINFEYATTESLLKLGDELAFFPPVTGG